MTEHNLPDKDDAPWLDTTYDGFKDYHIMTEYEQILYDIIADWWDDIFVINPEPLNRDGNYMYKDSTIVDLVKSISEIERRPELCVNEKKALKALKDICVTHEEEE